MADLPIPSASSAPAAVARAATNPSLRGAPARDGAAQADDDPFQAVLAQELGLVPGGWTLPGVGVFAAATDTSLNASDDPAQAGAPGDAALSPAYASVTPLPPALADLPPALAGLLPALAGLPPALAGLPPALADASPLPAGHTPAGIGRAPVALGPRQDRSGKELAAANAEIQLPAAPPAADFAAPGKFLRPAAAEIRREIAFDASLLEQRQPAPVASAAIHADTATPGQFTHAPAAAVDARMGEHGWDQALGDKLVWMAGQSRQVAQLHLNPPELGPLEITLTLNHDQASAQFVSAHALVRDAIEAAMPRLREMLADSGITLGNASVSADAFREQAQPQPQHEPRAYAAQSGVAMADPGVDTRGTQPLRLSRGLVDTFA